jgi:hypothetical protein
MGGTGIAINADSARRPGEIDRIRKNVDQEMRSRGVYFKSFNGLKQKLILDVLLLISVGGGVLLVIFVDVKPPVVVFYGGSLV